MNHYTAPLRLRLDGEALVSNWRWLQGQAGGVTCGAAVKANGYGLGAIEVTRRLMRAGCRDFFVSNWGEAAELEPLLDEGVSLSVLHGVRDEDMVWAMRSRARPVLNTPGQVARWREAGGGLCDVMIDTGMNRLGLDWRGDLATLTQGLTIATFMSHFASADEDGALNAMQRERFVSVCGQVSAQRYSLANSAGICLGADHAFDLVRPGLALYGGIPRDAARGHIRPVVQPQAQVLQRRCVVAGDTIGYNATYRAERDMEVAILNLGYADGYLRGFSGQGLAVVEAVDLPLVGRVSMDLIAIDVSKKPGIGEGDWVDMAYNLPTASKLSGLSQYELLTGLGARYDRVWT